MISDFGFRIADCGLRFADCGFGRDWIFFDRWIQGDSKNERNDSRLMLSDFASRCPDREQRMFLDDSFSEALLLLVRITGLRAAQITSRFHRQIGDC